MKIADQPNLVGTIFVLTYVLYVVIAFIFRKRIINNKHGITILGSSLSFIITSFLYIILRQEGFTILNAAILFICMVVLYVSGYYSLMKLHRILYKLWNK